MAVGSDKNAAYLRMHIAIAIRIMVTSMPKYDRYCLSYPSLSSRGLPLIANFLGPLLS